jgi:hypothetical protein
MNSHFDTLHFDHHSHVAPSSMRKGDRPYADITSKLYACEVRLNHLHKLKSNSIHDQYYGKSIGGKVSYLELAIRNVHEEIRTLRNEEVMRHFAQATVQLKRSSWKSNVLSFEIDFAIHGYCFDSIFTEPLPPSAPIHAHVHDECLSVSAFAQVPEIMIDRDELCRTCPLSTSSVPASEWMFNHPPKPEQSFHDCSSVDNFQTQSNSSANSSPSDLVVAPITQITSRACDLFQDDSSGISDSQSPSALITRVQD